MAASVADIIAPATVARMRELGGSVDSFGISVKQIMSFQMLLYDSLNDLAGKFATLHTNVIQMDIKLTQFEDALHVASHMDSEHISTADGVPLESALIGLREKISNISARLVVSEKKTERIEALCGSMVYQSEVTPIKEHLSQTSLLVDETVQSVALLRREMQKESSKIDGKWEMMKSYMRTQITELKAVVEQRPSYSDLEVYCKYSDLSVLCTLFSSLPLCKRVQIREIVPQVFQDSGSTMEEKLKLAFEQLHVERERVDLEDAELVREFEQLRQLILHQHTDHPTGTKICEVNVRDIATESGFTEVSQERPLVYKRGQVVLKTIGTQFRSEQDCSVVEEPDLERMIGGVIAMRAAKEPPVFDKKQMTLEVVNDVQQIIERQLTTILSAVGVHMDPNDIHVLVQELRLLEQIKNDMNALKVKMKLKVDSSLLAHELDKYLRREDFFTMMDEQHKRAITPRTRPVRPVPTPPSSTRKPKPEVKAPTALVPARNPKMLAVNDKYLIGDDGKTYLKESTKVADRNYREPPITGDRSGSRVSYYDRSKMSMEIEGVDAVIDFQPFVPAIQRPPSREDEHE
jgi:hypothetical protein